MALFELIDKERRLHGKHKATIGITVGSYVAEPRVILLGRYVVFNKLTAFSPKFFVRHIG